MQSISQIGTVAGSLILAVVLALVAVPLLRWVSSVFYLVSSAVQHKIGRVGAWHGKDDIRITRRTRKFNGVRHLLTQPLLRKVTITNIFTNAAVAAANTLLPVFALATLGLAPAAYVWLGCAVAAVMPWVIGRSWG